MWYGRLATTSYGGGTSVDEVLVERVALDEAERARRRARPSNRSRRNAARPRSSSTAVTAAPASSSPPVRNPSPGPISSTRRSGPGSASARIASSTSGSARKFWLRAWRARRPASRSVRRTAAGSIRTARAAHRRASGSDGRASRSRSARSPAANRRAPAAPIIAPLSVHRAGRGTISGQPERLGLAGEPRPQRPLAATPPPSTIERAPTASAARIVFVTRTSTTASWKPHDELGDGRRRTAARRARRRPSAGRQTLVASGPRRSSAGPRSSGR